MRENCSTLLLNLSRYLEYGGLVFGIAVLVSLSCPQDLKGQDSFNDPISYFLLNGLSSSEVNAKLADMTALKARANELSTDTADALATPVLVLLTDNEKVHGMYEDKTGKLGLVPATWCWGDNESDEEDTLTGGALDLIHEISHCEQEPPSPLPPNPAVGTPGVPPPSGLPTPEPGFTGTPEDLWELARYGKAWQARRELQAMEVEICALLKAAQDSSTGSDRFRIHLEGLWNYYIEQETLLCFYLDEMNIYINTLKLNPYIDEEDPFFAKVEEDVDDMTNDKLSSAFLIRTKAAWIKLL